MTLTIPKVQMHKSGPPCSGLVWGTMRSQSQFSNAHALADHLRWLLDHGITTLDTASVYGHPDPFTVEEFLGEALAQVGADKFEIVTKCGIQRLSKHRPENKVRHFDFSEKEIRKSTDLSLQKLGVDCLDVMLLHRPDYLMDPDETAGTLDDLVAQGKIKHVGVSNLSVSRTELVASRLKAPIVTNQIEFSPLHLNPISDGTFDHAIRTGYKPMIWSPIGGGRLLTSEDEHVVKLRGLLGTIAKTYGLDGPADAAIAFVNKHPVGGIPVVGSGNRDRILGAIKAINTDMDRQDWYSIIAATNPSLFL
ncbi:aldo/keto reductase [Celeribacter sp.]|uniref:aldo/keto reductase n=1 Tax=Celeribacter sp. TaxID=1890673 RepID=UPI003A9040E7